MKGLLSREVRSELVRSCRKGVLLGWFGLSAAFAVLINTVMYGVVVDNPEARSGPGVTFPTLQTLESSAGLTAGLSSAASMLGVVTLAFWAVLTATDYSSGLMRLLVAAQPRRWRLLLGKVISLAMWTACAATVALVVHLGAAPAAARTAGIDTGAWSQASVADVASAWVNLLLTLLVWGFIGLALATLTRSSAIAVSVGAGYVLVVDGIIRTAAGSIADVLPSSTLTALAQGGNSDLGYTSALLAGSAYLAVGLVVAMVVLTRRDITD
jgi:ABC-type transport system involved in multi-copper enzyme maturation permease subunit